MKHNNFTDGVLSGFSGSPQHHTTISGLQNHSIGVVFEIRLFGIKK